MTFLPAAWWRRWQARIAASTPAPPPAGRPARCEIQFHAASRRGGVYHLRLGRGQLTALSVGALLYFFLVALAAGMAPGVVGALLGGEEYRVLAAERLSQGERLHSMASRLEVMGTHSAELLLAVRQVAMAYGLDPRQPATPAVTGLAAAPAGAIYDGTVSQGERLRQRIEVQIGSLETLLAAVRAFEQAHPEVVRETPAACPLRGDRYVLSTPFGRQRSAFTREFAFHSGIDLAAAAGTPIHAPADGVVVFAGTYPLARSPAWWRYGTLVAVAHGERFLTLYGHCGELRTAVGRQVRRGDELATVGSSGWSLSPHLHYEVRRAAAVASGGSGGGGAGGEPVPVDPLLYIFDRRWPGEERLLAQVARPPRPGSYEALPPGLGWGPGVRSRSRAPLPRRL